MPRDRGACPLWMVRGLMAQLGPIKPGDIVELEIKGREFVAKVTSAASGRPATITVRPCCPGITYRTAKARDVVAHYRKTKNVRQVSVPVDVTPEHVQH